MFKSFRDSDVISSSVSELRGALARIGESRPEKNSSSPMVRSEWVYKSVRKMSGSQVSAFAVSTKRSMDNNRIEGRRHTQECGETNVLPQWGASHITTI
jgi:hypothetical protein